MNDFPSRTQQLLKTLIDASEQTFDSRFRSLFAVGAVLHPARPDRFRSPETILVVTALKTGDLRALASRAAPAMRRGARLRVLTEDELHGSADVFALEIAEWKARHRVLAGKPVLDEVEVEAGHLRHSLEEQLRGLSRRLRNRVLAGLGTSGRRDDERLAVAAGIERLLVIAHHLVALVDDSPKAEETEDLRRLGELADVDARPALACLAEHRGPKGLASPAAAFDQLQPFLDGVTRWCDALEVRR